MDEKRHTGNVITLNRGPIYTKSPKQRAVTKTSCEAGILVLLDIVSTVAWIRGALDKIEGELSPPLLLEDNKAAKFLVTSCPRTAGRVRHVQIRNSIFNQFITDRTMRITQYHTHQMMADILTN